MNPSQQESLTARLLLAGVVSLVLLTWIAIGKGIPPLIVMPTKTISTWPIMLSGILALLIIADLLPVLLHGSATQRLVAILLGLFPGVVSLVITLWAIRLLQTHRF
jgi:hypothetical protein